MLVTLNEMKNYLRVDYDEDDALIESMVGASERLCISIRDLDLLTIGMVNDMYAESSNDSADYSIIAGQDEFDLF